MNNADINTPFGNNQPEDDRQILDREILDREILAAAFVIHCPGGLSLYRELDDLWSGTSLDGDATKLRYSHPAEAWRELIRLAERRAEPSVADADRTATEITE